MMQKSDIKKATQNDLKNEIASRSTDPNFYAALTFLPNPDAVLRKMNKSQEVFDAIMLDSHVLGELRSVRAGLLDFEWRLNAGGERSADIAALELCEKIMAGRPDRGMQWDDVIWNMAQAAFRGYRVHEVIWQRDGDYLVPDRVIDKPNRRFVFSPDNQLRLVTRNNIVEGEELTDYKWLLSRHMPSYENPYGIAVFSSCFWPYTFKHNGFKYFVKFCEKYGMPWAIGKYPEGTPVDVQNELADRLAEMVEDGVAAIPDAGSVELLSITTSGQLAQERLVDMCNREMSKALTSQTLATEIQGEGSRAASQTHREREQGVNASDRSIVCDTFNQLFAWITELNFKGAIAPTFEFYEEAEARQEWVDVLKDAREFIDIPVAFAHDRLQIPMAASGEDVLPRSAPTAQPPANFNKGACPHCGGAHDYAQGNKDNIAALTEQAAAMADELIADMAAPIQKLLKESSTLVEFREGLDAIYPNMDDAKLGEMTTLAMMTGLLDGMDSAAEQ
jgi:phage gp29-like protein